MPLPAALQIVRHEAELVFERWQETNGQVLRFLKLEVLQEKTIAQQDGGLEEWKRIWRLEEDRDLLFDHKTIYLLLTK